MDILKPIIKALIPYMSLNILQQYQLHGENANIATIFCIGQMKRLTPQPSSVVLISAAASIINSAI